MKILGTFAIALLTTFTVASEALACTGSGPGQVVASETSTGHPEGPFFLKSVGCGDCVSGTQLVNGVVERSGTGADQQAPGTFADGRWTPDEPLNTNNEYVAELQSTASPSEVRLVPLDELLSPSADGVSIVATEVPAQLQETSCEVSAELCPSGTTCDFDADLEFRDGRCFAVYEVAKTLQHQFSLRAQATDFDPHRHDCEVQWEIGGNSTTSDPGLALIDGELVQQNAGPMGPLDAEVCATLECTDRETADVVAFEQTCGYSTVAYVEPQPAECTVFVPNNSSGDPDADSGCSSARGTISIWLVLMGLLALFRLKSHVGARRSDAAA